MRIAFVLLLLILGCSAKGDVVSEPVVAASIAPDSVAYHFHDSSVPPPDHRSYKIVATPDKAHVVVDSYGDVITDTSVALTSDQWQSLLEVVDAAALSVKARKEVRPGCTGGTSESVSLSAGGGQLLAGSLAHCGGEEEGDLHGDIKAVKAAMKGLFSDWDAVIARE